MDGINECCRLRVNYRHSLLERTLAPASALASREWAMVTTVTICAWIWRQFQTAIASRKRLSRFGSAIFGAN
jgi:hypothetical protein